MIISPEVRRSSRFTAGTQVGQHGIMGPRRATSSKPALTVNLRVSKFPLKDLHEREIKVTSCCVNRLTAKRVQQIEPSELGSV